MKTHIINIADSEGLIIESDTRRGWAKAAKQMHAAGDDELLLADSTPVEFDKEEWTW